MSPHAHQTSDLIPVAPVAPVAPYIGGKRCLAQRLCRLIEATPHTTYAEPFVGMGGIFLRRRARPKCEIINDGAGEVANLFRCMRVHPEALIGLFDLQLQSRVEFERTMREDPATLTDLQRAARFLYLQRASFGGKVMGQAFGVNRALPARFQARRVRRQVRAVAERLDAVVIENLPWAEFVRRYDTPGTLFYLDPPYFGSEGDYGPSLFHRREFTEMAEALAGLKGRFILSLNDRPEVRQIFARFDVQDVTTSYSISGQPLAPARELIITG